MPHDVVQHIAGSKHAQSVRDLFDLEDKSESFVDGFWSELARMLPAGTIETPKLRTMDEDEAASFERSVMKFGKHKGERVIDIPIDYFTAYADSAVKIQAYLRSDRGRRRVELGS